MQFIRRLFVTICRTVALAVPAQACFASGAEGRRLAEHPRRVGATPVMPCIGGMSGPRLLAPSDEYG